MFSNGIRTREKTDSMEKYFKFKIEYMSAWLRFEWRHANFTFGVVVSSVVTHRE